MNASELRDARRKALFLWWLPPPPKAPDYSTPEAVTLRAQEAAWEGGCPQGGGRHACRWPEHVKMLQTMRANVKSDGKLYKDFKRAVARAQERLRDPA